MYVMLSVCSNIEPVNPWPLTHPDRHILKGNISGLDITTIRVQLRVNLEFLSRFCSHCDGLYLRVLLVSSRFVVISFR